MNQFAVAAGACLCSRVLCSPGNMLPSLYETGEHRTLFLKKGPLFPAIPKKGPMFPDMYVTGDMLVDRF